MVSSVWFSLGTEVSSEGAVDSAATGIHLQCDKPTTNQAVNRSENISSDLPFGKTLGD